MKITFTVLTFFISYLSFSQINLETFNESFKRDPKITFIYFYTEWCGICKIQDKEIKSNEELNKELNHDFYFIKFNGENNSTITFLNHDFKPNLNQHDFVTAFLEINEIAYPNWIILNKNLEIIGKYSGFISTKNFKKIIYQLKKEAN